MQIGLPSISTEEGAIPEMLDGSGIVVPSQNPNKLAEAIEKLLLDKDLYSKLSTNSQLRFESEYTLEKFESTMMRSLRESINK